MKTLAWLRVGSAAAAMSAAIGCFAPQQAAAQEPAKKPPASLDDELFQGLDDATTAPGLKPKPQPSGTVAPPPAATQPGPAPPSPKPSATAAKPGNPLDDELLKSLGGDDAPPPKPAAGGQPAGGKPTEPPAGGDAPETQPAGDPFERLTQQIRNVENRLRRIDSGDQTQEMQRKIVDDLEKLIAQIEEEQRDRQQQQSRSPSQPKPQGRSQSQPQPGQPQQQKKNGEGNQENDQARDSQDGVRNSTARKVDAGRMRSLLERAWGSLPERERQDVMQSSVDDFPTKYQFVIEEYFKALLRREE